MKKGQLLRQRRAGVEIIGIHTERFRNLMIILSSILTAFGLFLSIYWEFDEFSAGELWDNIYLVCYITFTVLSLILVILLVFNKFKRVSTKALAYSIHIYVFLIIAISALVCIMDLKIGQSLIFFLIIMTAAAGLFVVDPLYFTILIGIAYIVIMSFAATHNYFYFAGNFRHENFIYFMLFTMIVVASVFKQYTVVYREYKSMKRLEELSYIDQLTGLMNERSYIDTVEDIAERIKYGKMEDFAIVLMDVNNLKNTNDKYGHRFGCHLVVRCGHELPTIFPHSKLFHIGGDEFLAIVIGEDYINFDQRLEKFEEMMVYSHEDYDGADLIFSVARGFAKFEKGDEYKDVLQRADIAMYENKRMVKEKYHIGGR